MHSDFDFVDDEQGGRFVATGGPVVQLRQMVAKGEIDNAAKHYEETGAVARDGLLEEAANASFETKRSIALMFRKARDFGAAARVYQHAKLETEAAAAFEQAGEFAAAAACWERSGEVLKAAAAYERAGKTDQALELYRRGGAPERAAETLARGNRHLEAAKEFRRLNNTHAEVEILRAGLSAEPANVEIASRLAELMLQHGHAQPAAQLLMETTRRAPASKDDVRFLTLLATALEATGNAPTAAKVRARLQELPKSDAPSIVTGTPVAATPGADAYGFLKALPMFADLTLNDMKALYRVCTLQAYEAGQHLIEVGQPGKGLFLIVEGQVEVFAGSGPQARLLNTLGVGGYVGEISLVQDGPTSARVTARSKVKVLFISRDAFHQYVYGAPMAALRIYQLFTHNLAERVRVLSAAK